MGGRVLHTIVGFVDAEEQRMQAAASDFGAGGSFESVNEFAILSW